MMSPKPAASSLNRSHAAQVTLRIVIERPPSGVDYAVQRGRGRSYEAVQTQRSTGADLLFEFSVVVKTAVGGGPPVWTGPFVQGPPSARFIYVDIGAFAGQIGCWNRRLKIPLIGITWAMVDRGTVLEARVAGTREGRQPDLRDGEELSWMAMMLEPALGVEPLQRGSWRSLYEVLRCGVVAFACTMAVGCGSSDDAQRITRAVWYSSGLTEKELIAEIGPPTRSHAIILKDTSDVCARNERTAVRTLEYVNPSSGIAASIRKSLRMHPVAIGAVCVDKQGKIVGAYRIQF